MDFLYGEDPDCMTGKKMSKPKRDMLFERLLSIFHPTLTLDSIPDTVRAKLNTACKQFREWPDFDMGEVMVRYGRMRGRTSWRTAFALANHWDEFKDDERTVQPGMPSDARAAEQQRLDAIHSRECEDETAERNRARQAVQLADPNVVKKIHEDWKADPANEHLVRFALLPTDRLCVCWIAAELEARHV